MADKILVEYQAVPTGFDKVGVAIQTVTTETKQLGAEIKATFADKSIEAATKKLFEQGDVMGALVNKYGNATSALKAMQKELATMATLGQRGTKEFTELANATAHLQDTIQDTRGEIKKMASDTKVFDTMVQGARGVAAAFSVATGLAATFGDENKDLQKTLLKVQGAMAALQGVQELANIATEKGGIATKAYGVALQVVDKISRVTGLSMAASWALATAGITVVIAGVVALIVYLQTADDKSEEIAANEEKRQKSLNDLITKNQSERYKAAINKLTEFDHAQEQARKKAIINEEDLTATEIKLLNDKLNKTIELQRGLNETSATLYGEDAKKYKQTLEDRVLDAKVALKKIKDEIAKSANSGVESYDVLSVVNFKPADGAEIEPLITEKIVEENKDNGEQMAKDFAKIYNDGVKTEADALAKRKKLIDDYFEAFRKLATNLNGLTNAIFANETQQLLEAKDEQVAKLDKQKEAELASVGDNAERRHAIEERYAKKKAEIEKKNAIESAKIQRQQAIANKAFSIFNIIINTAQAITKALPNYALVALAAATGAIEIATVAAAPLPAIPKFEKGGRVIAGGRNEDGHLIGRSHREGGILIEAQGQEYIWDRETTAKHGDIIEAAHKNRLEDLVFHKYVVPMMKEKTNAIASNESYDDMLLRSTIRQSNKQTAKYIVEGISHNMKDTLYFATRYK